MNKLYKILLLIVGSLCLSSCALLPKWIGESEPKKVITGKRISALSYNDKIYRDRSLRDVNVELPKAQENFTWPKSKGGHLIVPENPALPKELKLKYSVDIGSAPGKRVRLNQTPVIADDKIFVVDGHGKVTAMAIDNPKKKLWQYKPKSKKSKRNLSGNVGISYYKGKIILTTGGSDVVALDAGSGEEEWRTKLNGITRSAPAIGSNKVYVNTVDNKLYAINANTGEIEWVHTGTAEELSIYGVASPVAAGDFVFAPYSSGDIFALKSQDGSSLWLDNLSSDFSSNEFYSLSDIDAAPVIRDYILYVISNSGQMVAYDIFSGRRSWEQNLSSSNSPWVAGDFVYLITNDSKIVCLYGISGGIKWIKKLPKYKHKRTKKGEITWSGPILAGDELIAVGSHGKIYRLSPHNGKAIAVNKIPSSVYTAPVVANNQLYLVTNDAKLLVFEKGKSRSSKEDLPEASGELSEGKKDKKDKKARRKGKKSKKKSKFVQEQEKRKAKNKQKSQEGKVGGDRPLPRQTKDDNLLKYLKGLF